MRYVCNVCVDAPVWVGGVYAVIFVWGMSRHMCVDTLVCGMCMHICADTPVRMFMYVNMHNLCVCRNTCVWTEAPVCGVCMHVCADAPVCEVCMHVCADSCGAWKTMLLLFLASISFLFCRKKVGLTGQHTPRVCLTLDSSWPHSGPIPSYVLFCIWVLRRGGLPWLEIFTEKVPSAGTKRTPHNTRFGTSLRSVRLQGKRFAT